MFEGTSARIYGTIIRYNSLDWLRSLPKHHRPPVTMIDHQWISNNQFELSSNYYRLLIGHDKLAPPSYKFVNRPFYYGCICHNYSGYPSYKQTLRTTGAHLVLTSIHLPIPISHPFRYTSWYATCAQPLGTRSPKGS